MKTVGRFTPIIYLTIFLVVALATGFAAHKFFDKTIHQSMELAFAFLPFGLILTYLIIDRRIFGESHGRKKTMLLLWLLALAVLFWALGEFANHMVSNDTLLAWLYAGICLLAVVTYQVIRGYNNFHKID